MSESFVLKQIMRPSVLGNHLNFLFWTFTFLASSNKVI